MSLTNCELTLTPSGPQVVADAPAAASQALADACTYRRRALTLGALDTDGVLAMRRLGELIDRLTPAPAAAMHVLRLDGDDVAEACAAAAAYVTERDTESYQPPEERARIAALRELQAPLADAQAKLMLAALSLDGATV
jgi:predicted RNA-binding Zn ribbon-like protein